MDSEARAWVARAVAESGMGRPASFELVKERAWATVVRVGTRRGDVFFKANAAGGRHEPALVAGLARDWPERVPAPLAVDPARGWMLTADHGRPMRDALAGEDLLATWDGLLPHYAELQLASAREPERWLRMGVPDRRLERVPALAEALLRSCGDLGDEERARMLALLPELEARCAELDALPLAAALEHGDLHDRNVLVGRGRAWLFDWADASVSHPFCSLLVTCNMSSDELESEAGRRTSARLRDAYLEPWTRVAHLAELRELFPVALWVAHVGRALDWQHMLRDSDPALHGEWPRHIASWLRRWLERRTWATRRSWP